MQTQIVSHTVAERKHWAKWVQRFRVSKQS